MEEPAAQPQPAAAPAPAPVEQKTAGLAIASLILGIAGFLCIGPLGSIPAIICGHVGAKKIKESPETIASIKKAFFDRFLKFPGIEQFYSHEEGSVEGMMKGELGLRSFCPNVRITASYLANEILFGGLLGRLERNIAPSIVGYDYINKKPFAFELFQLGFDGGCLKAAAFALPGGRIFSLRRGLLREDWLRGEEGEQRD